MAATPAAAAGQRRSALIPQTWLRVILGTLWVVDGLLQLQPQMFTMNMINGVMVPMTQGQPGLIGRNLAWITHLTSQHLTLVDWVVALVQVSIGLLLISGRFVRPAVFASILWGLLVWYGGEGMSMLLTGQASGLTGAPGAVLLYGLIGLAICPRSGKQSADQDSTEPILSRRTLRISLGCLWIFFAVLQCQPYWWTRGQLGSALDGMTGMGGWNSTLLDPTMLSLARHLSGHEFAWNLAVVVLCAGIGVSILMSDERSAPYPLAASLVLSLLIWWLVQAFGGILSGMATDFNSGLLLAVLSLGSIPPLASVLVRRRVPVLRRAPAS